VACAADGQEADRGLLRIAWDFVGRIVPASSHHLNERRLSGVVAIGCDEISYRRGQRNLTSVVDQHSGAMVRCSARRDAAPLQAFFDRLGDRKQSILARE
jgi:hypothetical protein